MGYHSLYFSYYLHGLHSAERAKKLPQHIFFSLGRQIVNKYAPARAVYGVARHHGISKQISR